MLGSWVGGALELLGSQVESAWAQEVEAGRAHSVVVVVAAVAATTSAVVAAAVAKMVDGGQLARPLLLENIQLDSRCEFVQLAPELTERHSKRLTHSCHANMFEQLAEHSATVAHNHWSSTVH